MSILEPFKRLIIKEQIDKDGEIIENKITVGVVYRSDGMIAWDNSRPIPNEYEEATRWSPASQLPDYAVRRRATVVMADVKPLQAFTKQDIELLKLDYASQGNPQLILEEYIPIQNYELLYKWWKDHYKSTLKDCDNPEAVILHLVSTD